MILYSIKNTNSLKSKIPRLEEEPIIDKTIFSKDVSKLIKKYESFLTKLRHSYDLETVKPTNGVNFVNSEIIEDFYPVDKIDKQILLDMINVEEVRYEKKL